MRAVRFAIIAAIVIGLVASSAPVVTAQEAEPSPAIHGWPSYPVERNPAGLYSWRVGDHGRWMHKVPDTSEDSPGSVDIRIGPVDGDPVFAPSLLTHVDPDDGPYPEHPVPVSDVRTQTWILDVDDTRVYVLVDSYPDTDPSLTAEAVAVVESIKVQPTATGEARLLVFELPAGWDDA